MKNKYIATKTLVEICRLLVGAVFVFSGFVKAVDPVGFEIKMGEYMEAWGIDVARWLLLTGVFVLIAAEFSLGVSMLLGVYRRWVTLLSLALMSAMTPLTLYLALFNPVTDCGCFGDALVISNWATFMKNVVLLCASVFAFIHHSKITSLYTSTVRWFIPLFACLYCMVFSWRNYTHLPPLDFRPYKVGANIPEGMRIPEGAPADEYSYAFVYEKEGVKKSFAVDDAPAGDSSWTFVESQTKLIRKGYTPPIPSFAVFDLEGNDASSLILEHRGHLLLLVAASLEKASDASLDRIGTLYDYAAERGIPFYCLTGSSEAAIAAWTAHTGAEYPFLASDATLLKTIIRSNPGLVWLKDGTIMDKWHYNDLPGEKEVNRLIETATRNKAVGHKKRNSRMRISISTFTLPLLLVWLYDLWRFRRKKTTAQEAEE